MWKGQCSAGREGREIQKYVAVTLSQNLIVHIIIGQYSVKF